MYYLLAMVAIALVITAYTVTPTTLNMGWTVIITPQGGSAITLNNVVDVEVGTMGELKPFYGGTSFFPVLLTKVNRGRSVKITGGNMVLMATIPDATPCTIVATIADPVNGVTTGGGAEIYTLVNAVVETNTAKGKTQDYGLAEVTFKAYATSGADPLTTAAA